MFESILDKKEEFSINKAQRSFNKNLKKRKNVLEKYQVLLGNGMSYQDVTKRLLKRYKDKITPESAFYNHVIEEMNEGRKFSDALRGWATPNEILIVAAGEESGDDINALKQCVNLMEKLIKMRSTIIKASIYPTILMVALFLVIYGFSNFMIPILTDFSEPESWDDSSQNLVGFSIGISNNIGFIFLISVISFIAIKKSLLVFTGELRDKIFDRIPPYSIYKEIQAGLFLVSLSTLLKSGIPFKKSLEFIKKESPPYLYNKVDEILDSIDSGLSEGEAMNTKFIGDIGDDIEDFAAGSTIEVTLAKLGDQVVNDKLDRIEGSAGALKGIAMFLVFFYILWAYSTFISITQGMDVS